MWWQNGPKITITFSDTHHCDHVNCYKVTVWNHSDVSVTSQCYTTRLTKKAACRGLFHVSLFLTIWVTLWHKWRCTKRVSRDFSGLTQRVVRELVFLDSLDCFKVSSNSSIYRNVLVKPTYRNIFWISLLPIWQMLEFNVLQALPLTLTF